MILAVIFLAVVCVFVWAAPDDLTKMVLAAAWVGMAMAAALLPILAALHVL